MDTFYIIILCLIIAVLIAAAVLSYLFSEKQRAVRARRKYYNMLKPYNAYCVISCNFLQGIEGLKENTPCHIYASNTTLTIATNKNTSFILELSQVKAFKKFNRDKIIPYMYNLALLNLQSCSQFIIIQYLSDNDETREIFFSLDIKNKHKTKNDYYLAQCDIFDFISPLISIQEITTEL